MHALRMSRPSPANDPEAPRPPTVILMPFEDAEEERRWDEIVEERERLRRQRDRG